MIYMAIHGDISGYLLNPPPKGQVAGSNPARDANETRAYSKENYQDYIIQ